MPFEFDFQTGTVKDTRKTFALGERFWKLNEDCVKNDFRSYINKYRTSSQKDASVEVCLNVLKGALLEATGGSCGWAKGLAR